MFLSGLCGIVGRIQDAINSKIKSRHPVFVWLTALYLRLYLLCLWPGCDADSALEKRSDIGSVYKKLLT